MPPSTCCWPATSSSSRCSGPTERRAAAAPSTTRPTSRDSSIGRGRSWNSRSRGRFRRPLRSSWARGCRPAGRCCADGERPGGDDPGIAGSVRIGFPLKLQEIAERLGCRLEGDGEIEIRRMAGIEQAGAGDLTFVANPKYVAQLATTRASAVIAGDQIPAHVEPPPGCAVLRAADPYTAFARALGLFVHASAPAPGIDRLSAIAPDATLGRDVSIGPFVVVGPGASVGAGTIVYP